MSAMPHAPVSPDALFRLRVGESAVLLALLAISPLLKGPVPPSAEATNGHSPIVSVVRAVKVPRRQLILSLLTLAAFTAFLDGTVTVANAIFKHVVETELPPWRGIEFYAVALLVAFAGFALVGSYKDTHGASIWESKLLKTFVFVALVCDIAMAVLIPLVVPIWKVHGGNQIPEQPYPIVPVGYAPAVHFGITVLRSLVDFVLFAVLFYPRTAYEPTQSSPAPQTAETSLLIPSTATTSAGLSAPKAKYGTFNPPAPSTNPPSRAHTPAPSIGGPSTSAAAADKPARTEPLSWSETGARLKRLAPYLWPSNNYGLQLLAAICLLIVTLGRVVNAVTPFKLSQVVDVFARDEPREKIWSPLLWYVGLRFLQSSGGLAALRDILWAPVMQYSDRSMSQLCFDHILDLSLAWHTRRKTGEVLRILDRGAAINHIFELLFFNIIPTLADISIALYVFFWYFGPVLSVIVAVVMVTYIALSIALTTWRTKIRREMNNADVTTRGIHTDVLLNYETVKYFGGEQHEGERYRTAIAKYQSMEFRVMGTFFLLSPGISGIVSFRSLNVASKTDVRLWGLASLNVLNLSQNFVLEALKRFIIFITYLAQLYTPLNSLGYVYRSINQNLVDTERLIELLDESGEVRDKPDAKELVVTDGVIEFDNVTFSYDNRSTALNGISFTIPRGGSVALVGESGSGKSTILRLLYRFYDLAPGNGAIRIDGQDIRDASLRKAIGVVPQDSVLFNDTIAYNVGYGKFGATAEEIENAARAAQMHERITSFPDGYNTKVGERGVRLSGGEKQRVSIARTLLKSPRVILLDEATSALDTTTERDIQKALQNLVDGRSSLSIAHRLSTIANSDVILVLHNGEIVESGSHRELVERDGRFAAMWADQISSADDTRSIPDAHKADAGHVPGYDVDAPEHDNNEAHILPIPTVDTPDHRGIVPTEGGPVLLGPGPVSVPVEHFPPAASSEELAIRAAALNSEVIPDVSFAAVVSGDAAPKAEAEAEVKAIETTEAAVAEPAALVVPKPENGSAAVAFPGSDSSAPAPVSFPKGDDDASVADSSRPPLKEATSSTSTPGITFATGVDGERIKAVAQRWRKMSTGAAAKSGHSIARLARRVSHGPTRHGSGRASTDAEGGEVAAGTEAPSSEVPPDAAVVSGDAAPKEAEAVAKANETTEAVAAAEPTTEDAPKAESGSAAVGFPGADSSTPAPVSFPKGDDDASVAGSSRPPLKEATSDASTPGVTFAAGVDGERIKAVAQRWRKMSTGAAAKSGQSIARLARRVSQAPNRHGRSSTDVEGGEVAAVTEVKPDAAVVSSEAAPKTEEGEAKANETTEAAAAEPTSEDAPKAENGSAVVASPAPDSSAPAPAEFPKGDDDASVAGSSRPPLKEATSDASTPGVSFAAGVDGERIKAAAQRWRKMSTGAATKSGQSLARLARRVSQAPNRTGSVSSAASGVASPPGSPGFPRLSREGSARMSTDVEGGEADSVAGSDKKKKDKKDKRKSSD
ncbi:hypothetical protein FRC10_010127 [Ceratobasidium sp. 414]|nr:hypothetical protein FRC10_010127 [Ceratobasidium sp. 414]